MDEKVGWSKGDSRREQPKLPELSCKFGELKVPDQVQCAGPATSRGVHSVRTESCEGAAEENVLRASVVVHSGVQGGSAPITVAG